VQVTDEHFVRAAGSAAQNPAHNTTQQVGMERNESETKGEISKENAIPRMPVVFNMAEAGVEPARGLPLNGF
jgi:cell pole-organizing protein PopZ